MFNINVCQCQDSNRGPLISEAAALPTESQPLPKTKKLYFDFKIKFASNCLAKSSFRRDIVNYGFHHEPFMELFSRRR